MMPYGVLAFSSAHGAIRSEKHLKGRFSIQLMPTPRLLAASCGVSIRVSPEELDAVCAALSKLPDMAGCWTAYAIGADGDARPLA